MEEGGGSGRIKKATECSRAYYIVAGTWKKVLRAMKIIEAWFVKSEGSEANTLPGLSCDNIFELGICESKTFTFLGQNVLTDSR